MITLAHGLQFADLYSIDGANRIDRLFLDHLRGADAALYDQFNAARSAPDSIECKAEAALLIASAPHLEDFLAQLFGIAPEVQALEAKHHELAPLFAVKRQFVQRKAANAHKADEAATFDGPALRVALEERLGTQLVGHAGELAFATAVTRWLQDEPTHADDLALAARYAAWSLHTPAGRIASKGGVLFRAPRKLDYLKLVPLQAVTQDGVVAWKLPDDHSLRRREGFALTDAGTDLVGGFDQAHYCIWCHEQGKDSCSHGLLEKKPVAGDIPFKKSPVQRDACRLSAGRAHLRVSQASRRWLAAWRTGDDVHRQSHGGGDRPPDLQRLHEILHLPKAGSGRHSRNRKPVS